MQIEESDGGPERRVLIALATSDGFLSRIMPYWSKDPLASRWSNIIATWCVDHYRKYQQAPVKALIGYYEEWARASQDENTSQLMNRFLVSLSDEYDRANEINVDVVLDEAEKLFNEVRLTKLEETLRQLRQVGEVKGALEAQQNFRPVSFKAPTYIDLMRDRTVGLSTAANVLIRFRGALGTFFGTELSENRFVAFAGVVKGAKSFTLLELAWQAMWQRKRVAYFQIGDLTQDQIVWRFRCRAARRPLFARRVNIPIMLTVSEGVAQVVTEAKNFETDLSVEEGQEALEKYAGTQEWLRMQWYPVSSVTIEDIRNQLVEWDRSGWKAQVVVIDYLENLAPCLKKSSTLENIDYTWAIAKQISETAPRLVITAHQTNKEGFRARVLSRQHFRGNLKVLAHVTAFCGINHTDEEKRQQLWRYNYMVSRADMFSESRCATVASCLDFCQMAVLTQFE